MVHKVIDTVLSGCAVAVTIAAVYSVFGSRSPETVNMARELAALVEGEMPLPPIEMQTVRGDTIRVPSVENPGTLLYFFSTTCPACRVNEPYWQALVDSASTSVAIAALSPEPLQVLMRVADDTPKTETGTFSSRADRDSIIQAYRLFATPMTFLLDGNGLPRLAKAGVLTSHDVAEFLSAIRAF